MISWNLGKIYKFWNLSLLTVGEIRWRHADTWWRRLLRKMGLADDVRKEHSRRRGQFLKIGLAVAAGLMGNPAHAKLHFPEQLVIPETVAVADYADYIKQTVIEMNPGVNPDSLTLKKGSSTLASVAQSFGTIDRVYFEKMFTGLDEFEAYNSLISRVPQEAYHPTLRHFFENNMSRGLSIQKAEEIVNQLPKDWYAAQVGDTYRVSDILEREYGSWFSSLVDAEKERLMHAVVDHNPNAGFNSSRIDGVVQERYFLNKETRANDFVLVPYRGEAQNLLNYDS